MGRFRCFSVALAVALFATGTAQAQVFEFNFPLEGTQEVPPNDTNAAGVVSLFEYDMATQTFDLDTFIVGIGIDDLFGVGPNSTPFHIHMASPGTNGPIVVDLGLHGSFFEDGSGIRLQLDDVLLGGVQGGIESDPMLNEAALFAGDLYVNLHTSSFPGGHLRGQVVPEPVTCLLLLGGTMFLGRSRRPRRRSVQ